MAYGESSLFNLGSVVEKVHVTKHHDTGKEKSGRVGLSVLLQMMSSSVT